MAGRLTSDRETGLLVDGEWREWRAETSQNVKAFRFGVSRAGCAGRRDIYIDTIGSLMCQADRLGGQIKSLLNIS